MEKVKNKITNCKGCGTFKIVFNGSSNLETDGYYGISHLIEHCMCEKVKEIEPELRMYGITWNACTSERNVKFYISGLIKNVNKMIDKFTKAVLNYKITKEVFEREQKIVISEYNQYYSDQLEAFYLNFQRRHYNICNPIGLRSDLEALTYEKFIEYKNKYFSKPTYMTYVHPKGIKDLTEADFKDVKFNSFKSDLNYIYGEYNKFPIEVYSKFESQRIIMMTMEIPDTKDAKNYMYAKIFKGVTCGGLTSPLYQEIREKLGYVYSIMTTINEIGKNKLSYSIIIMTETSKVDIVKNKLIEVIRNIKSYINKKQFDIEIKKIKNGNLLNDYTSYDLSFNEKTNKYLENIKNDKYSYDEFLRFVDEFVSINKIYETDDEYK